MKKVTWKPGTFIYPLPAVMVSCGASPEDYNIITISWTGTICSNPPMCYISVRPQRHSYEIIKKYNEFVINLTKASQAFETDWCGVKSGKDFDKFSETKFTPLKAKIVKAPLIAEAPVNIECIVKEIKPLGSHDMFISEVVAIHADESLIDEQSNSLDLEKANLLAYSHGFYYSLGKRIGRFGFSVMKKKTKKRRMKDGLDK